MQNKRHPGSGKHVSALCSRAGAAQAFVACMPGAVDTNLQNRNLAAFPETFSCLCSWLGDHALPTTSG